MKKKTRYTQVGVKGKVLRGDVTLVRVLVRTAEKSSNTYQVYTAGLKVTEELSGNYFSSRRGQAFANMCKNTWQKGKEICNQDLV